MVKALMMCIFLIMISKFVFSAPTFSSIQFPEGWCHVQEHTGPANCLCEDHGLLHVKNLSEALNQTLASSSLAPDPDLDFDPKAIATLVDWWTEGVILPTICTVGILGTCHVTRDA